MEHDMYSDIILDYYRNPRHKGTLENPSIKARDVNESCGDVIEFQAITDENNTITSIAFSGHGCVISQAAASLLAEAMQGKQAEDVAHFTKEQMLALLGIPIGMMRMKCALLGLKVLKYGTYEYLGKEMKEEKEIKIENHETPETEAIKQALRQVLDPEIGLDVVTLGLIYGITVKDHEAKITMTLTTPMCPFGPQMVEQVIAAAKNVDGIMSADVDLVFDPPWQPPEEIKMMLGV